MIDQAKIESSLLAFDYGEKRIGVATSAAGDSTAKPEKILPNDSSTTTKIKAFIKQCQPNLIIVGRPRNLGGETTAQTKQAEDFGQNVEKLTKTKVVFIDEALSSQRARERLGKVDRAASKRLLDSVAAQIILEDYLNETS